MNAFLDLLLAWKREDETSLAAPSPRGGSRRTLRKRR
jgi:hypothetical protein